MIRIIGGIILIIMVMISGISGCGTGTGEPDDFTIKYVGRQKLKESLRDPSSLEIISEEVTPEKGYKATFRAKNGFGGYSIDSVYYP
jgi:hypothetical protein